MNCSDCNIDFNDFNHVPDSKCYRRTLADASAALTSSQADVVALTEKLGKAKVILEEIQEKAEKYQFDTGAIARGTVQVIRAMSEDALKELSK